MLKILRDACLAVADEHYRKVPRWLPDVSPLMGHCVVVSLMVQGMFGGDILKGRVHGYPHFWNRLPDGREIDLTSCQFGGDGVRPIAAGRRAVIAEDCLDRLVAVEFATRVQGYISTRRPADEER